MKQGMALHTGHLLRVFVLGALAVGIAGAAPAKENAVAELIRRAGSAAGDEERLELLRTLHGTPDMDEQVRRDTARMIAEVERWLTDRSLAYFGGPIRKQGDYDFGIAESSPVYPITQIYRGRMHLWVTLEYGGYWNDADERRAQLDKVRAFFEAAHAAFPENPIIRMYLGEPIPPRRDFEPVAGAPAWAVYQREGLEGLADIIEWWVDHRMQENGAYGGGWGDDCEMWRWWVPVLIGFDDPKITAAQARFSTALLSQEHMRGGYTTHVYDVEHTSEDSADATTPMMHLEPGNPAWSGRALRLAELMEHLWTGINDRGLRQFKSTYFSVDTVDPDPRKACDTVYHPRAVQPALLYWQRTGDPALGALFTAWMDTWVDAAARAERGKPAGVIPSAIHWPDGNIGGLGEHWWDPENHTKDPLYVWPSAMSSMLHTLLLTHHMTGDPKYLEPLRGMAKVRLDYLNTSSGEAPEPGSRAWCGARLRGLTAVLTKHAFLTGSREFDELIDRDSTPYAILRRKGDREPLEKALRQTAQALRLNFPGYTSEVRYTDRVLRLPAIFEENGIRPEAIPGMAIPLVDVLYASATGDPAGAGISRSTPCAGAPPARHRRARDAIRPGRIRRGTVPLRPGTPGHGGRPPALGARNLSICARGLGHTAGGR